MFLWKKRCSQYMFEYKFDANHLLEIRLCDGFMQILLKGEFSFHRSVGYTCLGVTYKDFEFTKYKKIIRSRSRSKMQLIETFEISS